MPKPTVPQGPITFDGHLPKISLASIRRRLQALADDPLLGRVDMAVDAEDWQVAVGLLHVLSNNILEAHAATGKTISRINRTRSIPLFPELEQHTEGLDRHDH
jgi:hypothetical protein